MKKDGGPAFPRSDGGWSQTNDGMSLRDWFAGQVLNGITSADPEMEGSAEDSIAAVARTCYNFADAMLAERAK